MYMSFATLSTAVLDNFQLMLTAVGAEGPEGAEGAEGAEGPEGLEGAEGAESAESLVGAEGAEIRKLILPKKYGEGPYLTGGFCTFTRFFGGATACTLAAQYLDGPVTFGQRRFWPDVFWVDDA